MAGFIKKEALTVGTRIKMTVAKYISVRHAVEQALDQKNESWCHSRGERMRRSQSKRDSESKAMPVRQSGGLDSGGRMRRKASRS